MNSTLPHSKQQCLFLEINPSQSELTYYITIATCLLNSVTALPSVFGSSLVLAAMWRNPNLDSPRHVFLKFLALSDFVTGFVVQPCYVIHKCAWLMGYPKLDCVTRLITETTAWISAAASCSLISIISLDRFLAVRLHMRYGQYVTSSRAMKTTIYTILSLIATSVSRYWAMNNRPFIIIGVVGVFGAVAIVICAYAYILIVLRRHKKKISAEQVPTNSGADESAVQAKATRKSAMSLAYVVGLFVVTYVPFVGALISGLIHGNNTVEYETAYDVTRTIVFASSALDPILYCWKITEVCDEVKKTWNNLHERCRSAGANINRGVTLQHQATASSSL